MQKQTIARGWLAFPLILGCVLGAAPTRSAESPAEPPAARAADERLLPATTLTVRAFSADALLDPGAKDIRDETLLNATVRAVRPKQGFVALRRTEGAEILLPCRPGMEWKVTEDLVQAVSAAGARSMRVDLFPAERSAVGQYKVRAYTPGGKFRTDGFMPLPADLRSGVLDLLRVWGLDDVGASGGARVDSGDPCVVARLLARTAVERYRAWTLTCEDALALEDAVSRCDAPVHFEGAPWVYRTRVRVTPESITGMLGSAAQRYLDIADRALRFEEVVAFDRNVQRFREMLAGCDERFRDWYDEPHGGTPRFVLDGEVATPERIEEVRRRIAR